MPRRSRSPSLLDSPGVPLVLKGFGMANNADEEDEVLFIKEVPNNSPRKDVETKPAVSEPKRTSSMSAEAQKETKTVSSEKMMADETVNNTSVIAVTDIRASDQVPATDAQQEPQRSESENSIGSPVEAALSPRSRSASGDSVAVVPEAKRSIGLPPPWMMHEPGKQNNPGIGRGRGATPRHANYQTPPRRGEVQILSAEIVSPTKRQNMEWAPSNPIPLCSQAAPVRSPFTSTPGPNSDFDWEKGPEKENGNIEETIPDMVIEEVDLGLGETGETVTQPSQLDNFRKRSEDEEKTRNENSYSGKGEESGEACGSRRSSGESEELRSHNIDRRRDRHSTSPSRSHERRHSTSRGPSHRRRSRSHSRSKERRPSRTRSRSHERRHSTSRGPSHRRRSRSRSHSKERHRSSWGSKSHRRSLERRDFKSQSRNDEERNYRPQKFYQPRRGGFSKWGGGFKTNNFRDGNWKGQWQYNPKVNGHDDRMSRDYQRSKEVEPQPAEASPVASTATPSPPSVQPVTATSGSKPDPCNRSNVKKQENPHPRQMPNHCKKPNPEAKRSFPWDGFSNKTEKFDDILRRCHVEQCDKYLTAFKTRREAMEHMRNSHEVEPCYFCLPKVKLYKARNGFMELSDHFVEDHVKALNPKHTKGDKAKVPCGICSKPCTLNGYAQHLTKMHFIALEPKEDKAKPKEAKSLQPKPRPATATGGKLGEKRNLNNLERYIPLPPKKSKLEAQMQKTSFSIVPLQKSNAVADTTRTIHNNDRPSSGSASFGQQKKKDKERRRLDFDNVD